MKKEQHKFFICRHCGNIIGMIHNSGVPIVCCGEEMEELVANTSDGTYEKHVPVVKKEGNHIIVEIGSIPHPMLKEHYIMWVYLETEKGGQAPENTVCTRMLSGRKTCSYICTY